MLDMMPLYTYILPTARMTTTIVYMAMLVATRKAMLVATMKAMVVAMVMMTMMMVVVVVSW